MLLPQAQIKKSVHQNYHGRIYAWARTFIAISTLSTLLFNDNIFLFGLINESGVMQYNNFSGYGIFQFLNIPLTKTFSVIILLSVIAGIVPRITGILHWWVAYSFHISSSIVDGSDQIAAVLTLLLIPFTLTDNRLCHWNLKKKVTSNYYISVILYFVCWLIKIQVAVIYLNAGIAKLAVPEWLNGTVLYYWINQESFGAPLWLLQILNPLLKNPFFITFLTWGTLCLEIGLSMSLFFKNPKVKKYYFISGVSFHLLIAIVHGLFSFLWVMCAALMLLLHYCPFRIRRITIFYDNWCPHCTRFSHWIRKRDFFTLITTQPLRDHPDMEKYKELDKEKATKKMAAYNGIRWLYGYASIYAIALRIPICLPIIPLLFFLKITRLGHLLYNELALKRTIIPLHCNSQKCATRFSEK